VNPQFSLCPKFYQNCILDFFTVMDADFRVSTYRKCVDDSALLKQMSCRLFVYSNSIFNLLVPPRFYFSVIMRHTESFLSVYPSSR